MCSGQNSLGKGGLNAKAGFYYSHIKGYISFLSFNDNEGNSKELKSKL